MVQLCGSHILVVILIFENLGVGTRRTNMFYILFPYRNEMQISTKL